MPQPHLTMRLSLTISRTVSGQAGSRLLKGIQRQRLWLTALKLTSGQCSMKHSPQKMCLTPSPVSSANMKPMLPRAAASILAEMPTRQH